MQAGEPIQEVTWRFQRRAEAISYEEFEAARTDLLSRLVVD